MKIRYFVVLNVLCMSFLLGCNDAGIVDGSNDSHGQKGSNCAQVDSSELVYDDTKTISEEVEPGDDCPHGGEKITVVGCDTSTVHFECYSLTEPIDDTTDKEQSEEEDDGPKGIECYEGVDTELFHTANASPEDCPHGGTTVTLGFDTTDDGEIDEITDSYNVCNEASSECLLIPFGGCMGVEYEGLDLSELELSYIDFDDSTLTDINFSGTDLVGARFNDAVLTRVDFTGANLQGAGDLTTAVLLDVVWDNTICPDGTNSSDNSNTCENHF